MAASRALFAASVAATGRGVVSAMVDSPTFGGAWWLAHVSLMTGTYPFTHGVRDNGAFTLGAAVPTLATVLHDAGYRTAAFVSAFVLDRRLGR